MVEKQLRKHTYFGGGEGKKYHTRDREVAIRGRTGTTNGVLEKQKKKHIIWPTF